MKKVIRHNAELINYTKLFSYTIYFFYFEGEPIYNSYPYMEFLLRLVESKRT